MTIQFRLNFQKLFVAFYLNNYSKTPSSGQKIRKLPSADNFGEEDSDEFSLLKKGLVTPNSRNRKPSILDVFENTLCTQEYIPIEQPTNEADADHEESSGVDQHEEFDIGDIGLDIANDAYELNLRNLNIKDEALK